MSDTNSQSPQSGQGSRYEGGIGRALEQVQALRTHAGQDASTPTHEAAGHTRVPEATAPVTGQPRKPGRRPSRTGAMQALLTAMRAHVAVSDRARRLMVEECAGRASEERVVDVATLDAMVEAEAHGAYFRKLSAWGYSETTSWDELVRYLPDLCEMARQAPAALNEFSMANLVVAAHAMRLAEGGRRFLAAAEQAMYFLAPEDDAQK